MDNLALYSRKCKTCKHLDPEEEILHVKCHFSRGNKDCPAAEVRIIVVGEARRFAEAVRQARSKADLGREAKLLKIVQKRDPAFQQKFKEWLSK